MTPTETQTLKIIWENKGKASVLKIAKELKISTDYSRLICRDLIKDKFVEFFEGQYKITNLGKKELGKLGFHPPTTRIEKVEKPKKPKKKTVAKRKVREVKEATPHQKLRFSTGQAITELSNLTPELIEALKQKGFNTLEDIATTNVSRLMELMEIIEGLELKQAAGMINEARAKLRKEGKEYLWE